MCGLDFSDGCVTMLSEATLELARRTQMENHFAGVSKMVGLGKAAP